MAGALSARLFEFLLLICQKTFLGRIAGYHLTSTGSLLLPPSGIHRVWLIPVSTTLGGLLAGVLVYTLAPEAEGHGTDTVVFAFHRLRGVIRTPVPIVKLVASALTIGSGGAAGREGPTALITAGAASLYARKRGRSEAETRLLLLVGMTAGLSAIFRSPMGTAIFGIEVLYGQAEFESGALVYTMLASIVAYAVNGLFVGFQPLFNVPASVPAPGPVDFVWYLVLGLACGVAATILPVALYRVRDLFRLIACPRHFKPAIGGLAVGLLAVLFPQLVGGGYGWIQQAIDGGIAARTMLVLGLTKILAFAFTIGSGGSGGVFAPSLFTGAMLGGYFGAILHQPVAAFAAVGMGAVFGGAARAPIATILMVTEMTGGYQFLVPASLAVIVSYLVQGVLSKPLKYRSLYEAQVPVRADSPAHYAEEVRAALVLLRQEGGSTVLEGQGLELIPLLSSGVPMCLGDGQNLRIGVLRGDSPCIGQPPGCFAAKGDVPELILTIRGDEILRPHPELRLAAGDRLVMLGTDAEWARMGEDLQPKEDSNGSLPEDSVSDGFLRRQ